MENKLTPELIAKAKLAKSAEELIALAKENGAEITAEEANTYFAKINKSGELSDDELDQVAGGCGEDERKYWKDYPIYERWETCEHYSDLYNGKGNGTCDTCRYYGYIGDEFNTGWPVCQRR